ncbi:MAG: ketopantoate reductase family protein [Syntrophaceae bacterium]
MPGKIKNVAIIGAGALGAVYASLLYGMDRESVCFIASGERCERLKKSGVAVNGRTFPIRVVSPDEKPDPAGLVIVAVKYHQLDEAVREIAGRVGENTVILSVMNGIDSEERLGAAYGMDKVLYAIALGIDALREGNSVRYTTQGRILFGEALNRDLSPRVQSVKDLFDRAGINYEVPADMKAVMWYKFMINAGINQASAVLRASYGVFQTSAAARELMHSAMREVVAVAGKLNINLAGEDMEKFDPVLASLSPDGKTSMLQDVEAGRKTEVEMLAGKLVELGEKYGVPTPVNRKLFTEIRQIENGYLKSC